MKKVFIKISRRRLRHLLKNLKMINYRTNSKLNYNNKLIIVDYPINKASNFNNSLRLLRKKKAKSLKISIIIRRARSKIVKMKIVKNKK